MKPAPSFRIPGPGAPQKPMTEEEKRDLLIRQAQQKLGAIAEGVIFNAAQSAQQQAPADLVDYAFKVAEAYVAKLYGVTFTPKPVEDK